jgi:hypothetical protein
MFKFLQSLARPAPAPPPAAPAPRAVPPEQLTAPGAEPFDVRAALIDAGGLPLLDWSRVQRWVDTVDGEPARAQAWADCERAWLAHLGAALGDGYRLQAEGGTLLLATLPAPLADATLAFVNKTLQRIVRTLDGVARAPAQGHAILVVFADVESYYRYVSHYYPEAGEFAASGGMYIDAGCGHFVTVSDDLHAIEPVIAHELTHACVGHLPIPAWLNEGLAVNTEQRLAPRPRAPQDPRRMHARHLAFWGAEEIQQFWSGQSFYRNDDGNELSYDLARILVAQFAADWPRFRDFVLAAELQDAGGAAAHAHLQLDLGAAVGALLAREPGPDWAPRPAAWTGAPERGGFRGVHPRR